MEKKTLNLVKKLLLFFTCLVFISLFIFFFIQFFTTSSHSNAIAKNNEADNMSYHIIVTGTYENQLFMQQVYEGALKQAEKEQAVVELYVPQSQADNQPLQKLLDYCVYVNADGIIAYIDSPEDKVTLLQRSEGYKIPLVTTGNFFSDIQQVSFIGNSYWELGKKIGDEILNISNKAGAVFVINEGQTSNTNYNNLINSMQSTLYDYEDIEIFVIEDILTTIEAEIPNKIFVCLSEDSTIQTAQYLSENSSPADYMLIGFGNNEACQIFLQKGLISELISIDPIKIGETAMKELFEYRNKGYANSYIAADVLINKAPK